MALPFTRPVSASRNEILRALDVLTTPGTEVELRAIGVQTHSGDKPHPISKCFTDRDELANSAIALDASAKGIYVTLNPRKAGTTGSTADTDIAERRWLPVDVDPQKAASTASSDEEHTNALQRACENRDLLTRPRLAEPGAADNG